MEDYNRKGITLDELLQIKQQLEKELEKIRKLIIEEMKKKGRL